MPTIIKTGGKSYVFVDGVKVAQVLPGGILAFHDRNRQRSAVRGTDQVQITLDELAETINNPKGVNDGRR